MTTITSDMAVLVESVRHLVPWVKGHLAQNEGYINAKLLQRTRRGYALPEWPEELDHFAVEREARKLRQRYIAELVGRGKAKLASAVGTWRGRRQKAVTS